MKRFVITFLLMLAVFTIVFSLRTDIEKQLELERVFQQLEQEYEQAVAKGDKIAANRAAAMYNDYIFSYSAAKLPKGIKYRLNEVE